MIPPSQRILPGASSVTANPAVVESSALARLTLSDDGVSGVGILRANGALSSLVLDADSTVQLTSSGKTYVVGAAGLASETSLVLSNDIARLDAPSSGGTSTVAAGGGAAAVTVSGPGISISSPDAGTLVEVDCGDISIGTATGSVGFRGASSRALAALPAPVTPTQAVASVAAGATQLSEANFQAWKTEVDLAIANIRTSLVDQGLAA